MIKALLRLVTIWFRYGESESVLIEVEAQLVNTPTKAWLMAIPQLIARLGTQHKQLQGLLIDLLKNIASRFPHAIIWPLFTASQTNKYDHQEAAREIMNYICTMSDGTRLVSQAQLVGRELIRASLSLIERYVPVFRPSCGRELISRWRQIIDKSIPRNDIMEIAWENIPAAWEQEMAALRVCRLSHCRSFGIRGDD
jgi:FKBP12-rapamycin complex-associated protein